MPLGPPRASKTSSQLRVVCLATLMLQCLSFPLPDVFTGSGDQGVDISWGTFLLLPWAMRTSCLRTRPACFYSSTVYLLKKEAQKVLEQGSLRFGLSNVTNSVFSPGLCVLSLSEMQVTVLSAGGKPGGPTVSRWGMRHGADREERQKAQIPYRCTSPAFLPLSRVSAASPKPELQPVFSKRSPTGLQNILSICRVPFQTPGRAQEGLG